MCTLRTDIIIPLQPHEIEAGLNNSPYYHRHVFKSSSRSLEGLHPVPLRHIALLSSEERAELLSQCEDIELQWELDVPRDEKWRYTKTRETLEKLSKYHVGFDQDEAHMGYSEGKSLLASTRHLREEASDKGTSTSLPDKIQQGQGELHARDVSISDRLAERDRILNLNAPRNTPAGLLKMNSKNAFNEELLRAADWHKTSADETEGKLEFLKPPFNHDTHTNTRRASRLATLKSTRPATSLEGVLNESHHKASGVTTRAHKAKAQHLQDRKSKKSIFEENASLAHHIDDFTNALLSDFQRAVVAAADEDHLSVSTLIANWEIMSSGRKTPPSIGTEKDPATQEGGEATMDDSHLLVDDAYSVQSLESLTDSDDNPPSSHHSGETHGSFLKVSHTFDRDNNDDGHEAIGPEMENLHSNILESNMMIRSDKEMPQNTLDVGSNAPLTTNRVCPPSSVPQSTQSESACTTSGDGISDAEYASGYEIEGSPAATFAAIISPTAMGPAPNHEGKASMPSIIEATIHTLDDEGTHTPEALILIMPTFPLSPMTAASHAIVSDHVAQVLYGCSQQSITDPTSNHHLPVLVQKPNYEDQRPPHEALKALANQQEQKDDSTSIPEHSKPPSAQGITPVVSAPIYLDNPVFEVVVFPNETEDNTSILAKAPAKLEFAAPSLFNLDGEPIDEWAQDLLTAIRDHTFLHPSTVRHESSNKRFDDASISAGSPGPASQDPVSPFDDANLNRANLVVKDTEVADDDNIEALHHSHVEIQDDDRVEAQPPKKETPNIDVVANALDADAEPTPIDDLSAMISAEWAFHIDFADRRPFEYSNPLAPPFPIQHFLQVPAIYPLTVTQKPTQGHPEPALIRYLETASAHFSSVFCCYVLISIFKSETRAPRNLYLIAGALLAGTRAVLYCFRRMTARPCAILRTTHSKITVNRRWLKVCGTVAVAVVAAAVAYGTYPAEQSGENLTTVATSAAVWRENDPTGVELDTCPDSLAWVSVSDSMTTCRADTPVSLSTILQKSPTNDTTNTWSSMDESDSDSYGAPKAVVKHISSAWSGPLWGLGISIVIGTVKYWWVQRMIEMYLHNYF